MSLLETFYILFESDAKDVKKGAEDADKSTEKLNKSLNASDQISKKVGDGFKNLAQQAGRLLVGITSAAALISSFKDSVNYAADLKIASDQLGVNVETLDAWGNAVKRAGGSAEAFQATVKSLNMKMFQLKRFGFISEIAPYFRYLGINVNNSKGQVKSFIDLLPDLAGAFSRIGRTKANIIGQGLGLDEGTINLLMRGRKEVEDYIKRQKELGLISKMNAELSQKFRIQLEDTKQAFRSLALQGQLAVLPILTAILKGFEKLILFIRENKDFIVGTLIAIGIYLLPILIPLALIALKFAAIAAAIGTVITAVGLLYEDIKAYYDGNDSLLGKLIEKWGWLAKTIKLIEQAVKAVISVMKEAFEWVGGIIDTAKNIVAKVIVKPSKEEMEFLSDAKSQIAIATNSPLGSQSSTSIFSGGNTASKAFNVQTGPITIETQATDAEGIAEVLNQSITLQMRQASNNFDDGIMA